MLAFIQVAILAFASLAVVKADTLSTDSMPTDDDVKPCKTCKPPYCSFDKYTTRNDLGKVTPPGKTGVIVQKYVEFHSPNKGKNDKPEINANFFYEGGSHSQRPLGTITSLAEEETALKIDLKHSGYPKPNSNTSVVVIVEADQTCTTGLPDGYFPLEITKITAGTQDD